MRRVVWGTTLTLSSLASAALIVLVAAVFVMVLGAGARVFYWWLLSLNSPP